MREPLWVSQLLARSHELQGPAVGLHPAEEACDRNQNQQWGSADLRALAVGMRTAVGPAMNMHLCSL